ncbi:sodium:solute symporter family protein [Haloplanus sp. GCM10025708]|uniref:sodium:solute symporter family protein n=1 Tax=Haloferacaceae TaxID=1644056 RepID=UPI00360730CB
MTSPTVLQLLPTDIANIIQANYTTITAVLVLYICLFLVLTYLANRDRKGSLVDYSVASRTVGVLVTTLTLFATINSGVGLAGFPGTIYTVGAPFTVMAITGFAIGSGLIWYFGRRIWILGREYNYVTPGDLLGEYYQSDTVRVYTVVVSLLFNITYSVAQLTAGGILIHVLSGGVVAVDTGVIIVAAVIVLHVITTGYRGIAWLDTLNGAIMLIVLSAFLVGIYLHGGGFSDVITAIGDDTNAFITVPGSVGAFPVFNIYGTGIGFLTSLAVMTPAAWLRFYGSDERDSFVGLGMGILLAFAFVNIIIFWIGAYGRVVFPNLENPDFVSSLLAFEILPIYLAALFLIALLAAIISTTDSYIHALSVTVGRDFVRALIKEDLSDREELITDYLIVLLAGVVAVIIALNYRGLIVPIAVFGSGIAIHLMPITFGAVAWPRASPEAAIVAPAVGLAFTFVWELGVVNNPLSPSGIRGLFLALLLNMAVFVAVSYATQPASKDKIEKFHGLLDREL